MSDSLTLVSDSSTQSSSDISSIVSHNVLGCSLTSGGGDTVITVTGEDSTVQRSYLLLRNGKKLLTIWKKLLKKILLTVVTI